MISFKHSPRHFLWPALIAVAAFLSACERSQPSASQIQSYIESYQIAHDYSVASMNFKIDPDKRGESGSIQVSGTLELREPLYVEDLGSKLFRKRVAKMLRRNRFSEREINHEIYDRVIRAAARVANSENEYYTFLKEEHAPGFAINFSADLIYKKGNEGFMLDGPVRHPKLLGSRIIKFTNPIVDDSVLVERAVKNTLAEQVRYREMMKESSALLSRLWDNDYGFIVWNRKVPYLGNENLLPDERAQLAEFSDWRGVFRISNIKPIQYNTPHASNFFELGSYTTEGVATCLRQTGFNDELSYAKSKFDQYCEFGKQYPARIQLASILNETNEFVASVRIDVNGASTSELNYDSRYFQSERNELARYSDQQRVVFLDQPFDIKAHSRPVFNLIKSDEGERDLLRLEYTGATDYQLAEFDMVDEPVPTLAVDAQAENLLIDDAGDVPIESDEKALKEEAAELKESADDVTKSLASHLSEDGDEVTTEDTPDAGTTNPLTKKELVKAIQVELKRLNVYHAQVDGVAGKQTFWSMNYVQNQLGKGKFTKPSQEFLTLLLETPDTAIKPPAKSYKAVARSTKPKKQKETIVGKALRGSGRAIANAASWVGGLFSKKEDKQKN